MKINSGFKIFDRQANKGGVFTGNATTDVQVSTYIRAYNCPKMPTGSPCQPGEMQKWDLETGSGRVFPDFVKDKIRAFAVDEEVIAYEFFYHVKKVKKMIGYSVTRPGTPDKMLWTSFTNKSAKAITAMTALTNEITSHNSKLEQKKIETAEPFTIPNLTPVLVW